MTLIQLRHRQFLLVQSIVAPCAITLAAICGFSNHALGQMVFHTDFESGLPPQVTAPGAAVEGVQGYAGLGPVGRQFGGHLLRYSATDIQPTTLSLSGLPTHTSVDLSFLLAVIDSWDGVELLQIRVDGQLIFSSWFQLATGDSSSYEAPPGGLLSSGTNLGWTSGNFHEHDRAYDMGVEPGFRAIPHSAPSLTIEWTLDAVTGGAAQHWQGGADESWGIDEVSISLSNGPLIIGQQYCSPAVANSTGGPGTITATGSILALYDDVTLTADQLPPNQFGYFLVGQSQGSFMPPGSQGIICLMGNIGRFNQVSNIIQGPTGSIQIDLTSVPVNPPQAVIPGDTWNFQCWYRDNNPGPTSNFTDAVRIVFR